MKGKEKYFRLLKGKRQMQLKAGFGLEYVLDGGPFVPLGEREKENFNGLIH